MAVKVSTPADKERDRSLKDKQTQESGANVSIQQDGVPVGEGPDPKELQQLAPHDGSSALGASDPGATQQVRLASSQLHTPEHERQVGADPRATQRVRLIEDLESESSAAPKETQPVDLGVDPPTASFPTREGVFVRAGLRQWVAQNRRILIGPLIALAVVVMVAIGVIVHRWLTARDVSGPQLRAAPLAQADLRSWDLRWADLSLADLRQANLSGVDLLGADLSGAELGEANLEGAALRGADLSGAKAGQAILRGADLHWALLRNADLTGADLRHADLQGADLENAVLVGAQLEGVNLTHTHLFGAKLPDGSTWGPSSDMLQFTDPSHLPFWRPENQ